LIEGGEGILLKEKDFIEEGKARYLSLSDGYMDEGSLNQCSDPAEALRGRRPEPFEEETTPRKKKRKVLWALEHLSFIARFRMGIKV